MNFHTRFVGALDAIILFSIAAVTVVMVLTLLDPAFASLDRVSKHGTVTIQQLALDDTMQDGGRSSTVM